MIGKGAVYLFIENLANLFSGYISWLIISKLATAEMLGTASTIITLAAIFTAVVLLGIPTGVQSFLGRSFSENKLGHVKTYLSASLFLTSIAIGGCSIFILIARDWLHAIYSIDFILLIIVISLVASNAISFLFRIAIISSLKTKILPIITIISAIARLSILIILLLLGSDLPGIVFGYASLPLIGSILMGIVLVMRLRKAATEEQPLEIFTSCKNILVSSFGYWIPQVITTLGAQLGTIVVFGTHGAIQAGVYFIAFLLYTAIYTVSSILSVIAFPVISSLDDGRKRLAWKVIRLSLIIGLPFSTSALFYASDLLRLIGSNYVEGTNSFQILLLSVFPTIIVNGIGVLPYAYKNHRQVLLLGIVANVPRTILYFVLVPWFGDIGAALSYIIGSAIGLVASLLVARKIGFKLNWKQLAMIVVIPSGIAFLLSYAGVNYVVGILSTTVISYLIFIKLRILIRSDVQNALEIVPHRLSDPATRIVNVIFSKLRVEGKSKED